jgi:cell wall-associated NlpC family hydrolase
MHRTRERIALTTRGRHPGRETAITAGVLLALVLPGTVAALGPLPAAPAAVVEPVALAAPDDPRGPVPVAEVPTVAPPPPDPRGAALPRRPAPAPVSPVAARVGREAAALEALAERAVEERETSRQLSAEAGAAEADWSVASDRYRRAQARAAEWARTAAATVAGRPEPLTGPTDGQGLALGAAADLGEAGRIGTEAAAAALDLARATQAYAEAFGVAHDAGTTASGLEAALDRRTTALDRLRAAYRSQLAAARRTTDADNAALSRRFLTGTALTGGTPTPQALAAVRFALAQLGKPYVWGAEGPGTYDCSGLVQTAYASAGIALPRTARPQYLSTTPIPVVAMLPGDLLFFGPDPDHWNSIHHVAVYLGRGLMVHAPTTGDVVRIAPIWWAEFFGATRAAAAHDNPATAPRTTRPPGPAGPGAPAPARPAPTESPLPSQTPLPRPAPSPAPTPSPPPGLPSPTQAPPPAPPSPPGSPSPPPGLPSPTQAPPPAPPSPPGSPSPSPSPSCPAPSPTGSASPTPTPSPSPTGPPDPRCRPFPSPTAPTPSPTVTPGP